MAPNKNEGASSASDALRSELLAVIHAALASGELSRGTLCELMGMKPSYLSLLLKGDRPWSGLRLPAVRALAAAINRPPMWVMVRTGRVAVEDFFAAPANETVTGVYEQMVATPALSGYVPDRETWESMSDMLRQQFVLMFQAALPTQLPAP